MCGSGMETVRMAHNALMAGSADIIIAGGMESMSNAPYILPKMRSGAQIGHSEVKDHMFLDGLEDAYDKGTLMGVFAEKTAEKYGFTRKAQDDFAIASLARANAAIDNDYFKSEITPVTVKNRKGDILIPPYGLSHFSKEPKINLFSNSKFLARCATPIKTIVLAFTPARVLLNKPAA